jgi:hypothetical protein
VVVAKTYIHTYIHATTNSQQQPTQQSVWNTRRFKEPQTSLTKRVMFSGWKWQRFETEA